MMALVQSINAGRQQKQRIQPKAEPFHNNAHMIKPVPMASSSFSANIMKGK
jgi:hypothetical protein